MQFLLKVVALLGFFALLIEAQEDEQSFYLVPVPQHRLRLRRAAETIYDINRGHVMLGEKVNILDNDRHKLDASAWASRDFNPKGPLSTGQGVSYQHKPSNSAFDLNAQNTRGFGTDLSASGTYNFYQTPDKRGTIGVSGNYDRHFGGPFGTGHPNYGIGINGRYNF